MDEAARKRLETIRQLLSENILGQQHVVTPILDVLTRGELGLTDPKRPKGTFLFVGPTGVGKTETCKVISQYLFERPVVALDMSEFQHEDSVNALLAPTGRFRTAMRDNEGKGGLFLFDEVEKAHTLIHDLFLQILDEGRVTPNDGQTIYFRDYYIVLTSNIGTKDAMRMTYSKPELVDKTILSRVAKEFRPEIFNRIQEKLVFRRLNPDVQINIAHLEAARVEKRYSELGHKIEVTQEALDLIKRKGIDPKYGARPLRSITEKLIGNAVARRLMDRLPANGHVVVASNLQELEVRPFES